MSVSNITSSSATISWHSSLNGGHGQNFYVVKLKPSAEKIGPLVDPGYGERGEYKLDGLLAGTSYAVRVEARNAIGSSLSNDLRFTTENKTGECEGEACVAKGGSVRVRHVWIQVAV